MRENFEAESVRTSKGVAGDWPFPGFGALAFPRVNDLAIALCAGANIFLA